jgi:hypothetical protein
MSDRTVVILRGVLLVVMLLAAPAAAQAATVMNVNDSGPGSLRDAIVNSASGETITFDPSLNGKTIALTTGVLPISHSLTISGPAASSITVNAGLQSDRVFKIDAANTDDVTISGLAITGGSAAGNGAGILADTVHTLTLTGDTIANNAVTVNNSAGHTGGGGVYVDGSGTLVVNASTIDNNTVALTGSGSDHNGGGGLYDNDGHIAITGSQVSDNTVEQDASTGFSGGGGIFSNGGEVDVTTSTVDDNTDTVHAGGGFDGGGGVYSNDGPVVLTASGVDANTFGLDTTTAGRNGGGGVYNNSDDVTLESSSVDDNTADVTDTSTDGRDGGGGIYANSAGSVAAFFSSVSGNSATLDVGGNLNGGGGVFDQGADDRYLDSTISGNSVSLSGAGAMNNGGGGIHSSADGLVGNVTIAGNSINAPGGGLFVDSGGNFALADTIIAGNGTSNCGGAGGFFSQGTNLESANTCDLIASGDLINTDPRLGPLQNNGGPTRTQALPAGSPAIDAGACSASILGQPLTVDQRGVARPQPTGGKCDIGAFELVPGGSAPPPPPASPPAAVAGPPTATSSTAASFSGSVNPNGQATTVVFQYGIDSRYRPGGGTAVIYDQSTPPQSLPADSTPHAVSASVPGLVPNALYHVRLVATNASGTTVGADQTFTTPAGPAPPPPVLGRTVNAKPISGQVFILVGTKLVPLTEAQQIPSGATLDARAGSLQLTAAGTKGHKRETGVFGGAVFKLTQARTGLTNLALAEGAFTGAPTFATCKAHKAGEASVAASKTLQLLHASAKGKFRTSGRYSAATVRGTKWTIADRCDGTLTRDIVHSVVVTDFVRHKTIVLHAGQSYLARAQRPGR